MSSAISTDPDSAPDDSFRPWHIFALLSMAAAAVIVWAARNTHPLSLLLLTAGVLACGFVGYTVYRALSALLDTGEDPAPIPERAREALVREKALLLRSIKELEFDKSMGKIGEADYAEISGRLRARALSLMQDIERADAPFTRAEVQGKRQRRKGQRARGRAKGKGQTPHDEQGSSTACSECGTSESRRREVLQELRDETHGADAMKKLTRSADRFVVRGSLRPRRT